MPGMTGPDLALAIHEDPQLHPIKLALLTSVTFRGVLYEKARQAGVTQHLNKPVRKAQLHECLRRMLKESDSQRNLHAATPTRGGGPVLARRGANVLLVEDNPVNQEVAKAMLVQLDCVVTVAENGRKAVEMVAQATYDLVLMDCQMPVMDGFQATALIREREQEQERSDIRPRRCDCPSWR